MSNLVDMDKPIQEKCGIVAIYNTVPTPNIPFALLAAGGVQHRGMHGAGMAIKTAAKIILRKGKGLFHEIFPKHLYKRYTDNVRWVVLHCRYGTYGSYHVHNIQPCLIKLKNGEQIIAAHNGEFAGVNTMRQKLQRKIDMNLSDTFVFTKLLAQQPGKTWDEKIVALLSGMTGSYNLIIGIGDTLYVARDSHGLRPLILGRHMNGWMVASETHAFDKVSAVIDREIKKGEILKINQTGVTMLQAESKATKHFCDFEWAYFSRPDSLLPGHKNTKADSKAQWISIGLFRERCGEIIAAEKPLQNASFVVGLPDSGIAVSIGYANALKLRYRQAIIRDHFDPNGNQRLFMRDDEKGTIGSKVLGKLSLIGDKQIWHNAVVVLGDDSIVRGNVSKKITEAVFSFGAKEVHWIIGFPPVQHACHLGVSMRSADELVAAKNGGDPVKIARDIGATSVNYISHRGFLKARLLSGSIQVPKDEREIFLRNGGCGGCITGLHPISPEGKSYYPDKLS